MSYNRYDNVDVSPLYNVKYEKLFTEEYERVWNMLAFITDEQARVSAVNCYMVSFTQAIGMQILGAVSFDAKLADVTEGFTTFAKLKANPQPQSTPIDGYQKSSAPAAGQPAAASTGAASVYNGNGPRMITEKQKGTLEKFLKGNGYDQHKAVIRRHLASANKAMVSELTLAEATACIGECFALVDAAKAAKASASGGGQ